MGKPPPEDVLALINEEKHAQIQREIKRMASKVAARKLNRMGMPTDGTIPLKMEIVEEIERKNKEEKLQQRIAHRNETKRLQEEEELEKTGEVTLEKMTSFLENTPEEDEDDGVEDRRALEKEELEKEELTEESEESGDYSGEDEDYDSDEDEDEKLDQLMEHLKNHDEPERVPITVAQTKAQTEPVVTTKDPIALEFEAMQAELRAQIDEARRDTEKLTDSIDSRLSIIDTEEDDVETMVEKIDPYDDVSKLVDSIIGSVDNKKGGDSFDTDYNDQDSDEGAEGDLFENANKRYMNRLSKIFNDGPDNSAESPIGGASWWEVEGKNEELRLNEKPSLGQNHNDPHGLDDKKWYRVECSKVAKNG